MEHLNRLTRLVSIQMILQSKRILTASDIAKRFDISKRTVYRDIKTLEAAGLPIYNVEGKGYALVDGFSLAPIQFTEEEALALITGHKFIIRNKDASLIEQHQLAIDKVKAVMRNKNKDSSSLLEQRVAFFHNYKNETTSDCLLIAQKAITNFQFLKLRYRSINTQEITERKIEPCALYHTKENWILIGWCHLRNNYREFRLDGIENVQKTKEIFKPRKFDLLHYFLTINSSSTTPES